MTGFQRLQRAANGALLLAAFTPAMATTDDIAVYLRILTAPRGEQNLRKHATCIANKYGSDARTILRADAGMKEMMSDHKNLLDFKCTYGSWFHDNMVTLNNLNYPQALAEAMLIKDYDADKVSDVATGAPLRRDEYPGFDDDKLPQKFRDELELSRYFHDLDVAAECSARKDPAAVFSIFATELNSSEEEKALSKVKPAFVACQIHRLQPEPPNYFIRGALAKNLYRLADEMHPVDEVRQTEHGHA